MDNAMIKVSPHATFTEALLAAGEHADGAVRHIDGSWWAVRLPAAAARYNARHARAARRPRYAGDLGEI
jgi:hypothetical protein